MSARFFIYRGVVILWCVVAAQWLLAADTGTPFDHSHAAWTRLLQEFVHVQAEGQASQVAYAGLVTKHEQLKNYLDQLTAVEVTAFAQWSAKAQMAFLINAYNAFTVALILNSYPDLTSIKDLASFFSSPWTKEWVPLFGQTLSLDDIEHKRLRAPGQYDDYRIHFAVNCASVGCPMLREEAYVADRLDAQLTQQVQRFLRDRSRNRFDASTNTLYLSKIFDWYEEDFTAGWRGIKSLQAFAARYATALADTSQAQELIRQQQASVNFLDYDWALNDRR